MCTTNSSNKFNIQNMENANSLNYAVEIALKRHEEEKNRMEKLNNRASTLLGYASGLGTLYFGFTIPILIKDFNLLLAISLVIVFLIMLIVIMLCFKANNSLLIKKYMTGPGGKILKQKAFEYSEEKLKSKILESYSIAFDNNYAKNYKAANILQKALIVFIIGVLIGFSSFIILLIISIN